MPKPKNVSQHKCLPVGILLAEVGVMSPVRLRVIVIPAIGLLIVTSITGVIMSIGVIPSVLIYTQSKNQQILFTPSRTQTGIHRKGNKSYSQVYLYSTVLTHVLVVICIVVFIGTAVRPGVILSIPLPERGEEREQGTTLTR